MLENEERGKAVLAIPVARALRIAPFIRYSNSVAHVLVLYPYTSCTDL